MEHRYIDSKNPPYKWINAYEQYEKTYKERDKNMSRKVFENHPFFTRENFRLIQVACLGWNVVYDIALVMGITWEDVKESILEKLSKINDERKRYIDPDTIEDIALSYTPISDFHRFGCIDKPEDLPFDVIPNNVILFVHQVKRRGDWVFTDSPKERMQQLT